MSILHCQSVSVVEFGGVFYLHVYYMLYFKYLYKLSSFLVFITIGCLCIGAILPLSSYYKMQVYMNNNQQYSNSVI